MNFRQLTKQRQALMDRVVELEKSAGVLGVGNAARKALSGTARLATSPLRAAGAVAGGGLKGVGGAMYRSSKKLGGPVLGPVMFGAGVLGTAGAAKHALGKSREYNRGFDPRIQELKLQGHKF